MPVLAQTEPQPEVNRQPATVLPIQPDARNALVPMRKTEQIRLQLVNCAGWLDCELARLLLPASATIDQRQLQFDNPTTSTINVLNTAVILDGDITGYQLSEKAIAVAQGNQSFPATQISSLPLTLNRAAMPPDQYVGAVYFTLNSRGRLSFPIDLSVRTGPLLPLVVLFFGIILGRLFKYMEERGEPQAKAKGEVYRLQNDIRRARLDKQEEDSLLGMTNGVQTLVNREQLEAASPVLQAIRDRLEMLIRLEALENEFNQQQSISQDVQDKTASKIHEVRWLTAQGQADQDAKAKQILTELGADFKDFATRGVNEDPAIEVVRGKLKGIVAVANQIDRATELSKAEPSRVNQFQQFFIMLSGVTDQVRAEATFWVVRPLLALILLVGLSSVGMGSLYIERGTTFGARPFADYLGLILWGLSADVASRSLSSLQGRKDP
ncbi:hypothetical protein NIES2104_28080 [Leptolyngbya sp. NIES-2104]|nr:hypothetical protein NIES2104_28080 [Leptolyngbya sp. NIES-2104]